MRESCSTKVNRPGLRLANISYFSMKLHLRRRRPSLRSYHVSKIRMEIGEFWVTVYLPDSSQEEIPHMDVQTLIAWEENRMPQKPRKQWGYGLLFIICIACAAFLFLFHESLPLPYPLAPISFLCVAIIFYVLGVMKYKARRSRLRERASAI